MYKTGRGATGNKALREKKRRYRSMNQSFGTCRTCKAHIIWIQTKAGRNMPVNPELIPYKNPEGGSKGKEKLVLTDGTVVSVDRATKEEADGAGYISHFATCPGAAKHRRK